MIGPRWSKVVRDVAGHPFRSLLVVLAMAAGIFEIGALTYKYALLQPVLTSMYGRTRPASATLVTDDAGDAIVEKVRRVRGVADAEARPVIVARARVGPGEWVPALLYVVRDFRDLRVDTFEPEKGAWPPGDADVLLERTALRVAGVAIGDSLTLRPGGGGDRAARVAGTVYAAGLAPAWMEHMVPGFVPWRSPLREGGSESAQIRIVVANHPLDEGYIHEVADSVRAMLEREGHVVTRVNVPAPGRHPHADQMDAFLFLLLAFGVLSFVLSAILAATMVHALMAEQVREVGIMKAIGATDRQVAGLYLAEVGLLAAIALAIGIPLGLVVGGAYARFAAGILNANIGGGPFPAWVLLVDAVVGLGVPLLFALGPVRRASGISVREALAGGGDARSFRVGRLARALGGIHWLPRPLLLSLRTTLQRRGRLVLGVGMLAIGGATFVSALNVSGAWTNQVRRDFAHRRYDLTVGLARAWPADSIDRVLAGVPDVERAEYWPGASPYLIGANGIAGGTVSMTGPARGSRLLELPLVSGRWLRADDESCAVINTAAAARDPALRVGGVLSLRVRDRTLALPIVGVVRELAPMPVVYAPPRAVRALSGEAEGLARTIRIVTRRHDDEGQRAASRSVEAAFERAGIEVGGSQRMLDVRKGILDHLVIIYAILTMAALVVVGVGSLALASTLTLSVVQRTREIGILGAIGATPGTIARHVWFEGVLIGLLSWTIAIPLAAPLSGALEAAVGGIFFKAPLDFYMSPLAAGAWLAIVVVLASLSSFHPALRAARFTVREALAHA